MPAHREKDDGPQGHQQHIAHIAGHIRHDAGHDQDKRQQPRRRRVDQQAQQGTDQATFFGHADAQQRHQDRAQGSKAGIIFHCVFKDPVQAVA